LTRSPTRNAQEIAPFSAPVSRSISFQIMLVGSDARLISGIRSFHSRPSLAAWVLCEEASCATAESEGTSFIPQIGHVAGSVEVTPGCIGHTYAVAAGCTSPQTSGIADTNAINIPGARTRCGSIVARSAVSCGSDRKP